LGQNFLINRDILQRIVAAAGIKSGDRVLEVGPGLGFLTYFLLEAGAEVYSFEKDRNFFDYLRESFKSYPGFHLVEGDFLKADLEKHFPPGVGFKMVANIPYNITSPVFGRVVEMPGLTQMVVTVQRQVAERIVSVHACKTYGAFTLFCKFYTDPELLFHVSPGNFHPAPSVYSSVVRLTPHQPPLEGEERKVFFQLVKSVFASRRKTLRNSFKRTPFFQMEDSGLETLFEQAGLTGEIRGEKLTLEKFAELARIVVSMKQQ